MPLLYKALTSLIDFEVYTIVILGNFFEFNILKWFATYELVLYGILGDAGLEPALFGAKNQRFTD